MQNATATVVPMHKRNTVAAVSAGKAKAEKPKMTSAEVLDTVAAHMVDPKDVANKKAKIAAEQEAEKKAKDAKLEQKLADERHKQLQEAQDQGKEATDLMAKVVEYSQEIARMQFEYKQAAPEAKEKIKAKALAVGVLQLEAIEQLLAPVKASKTTLMGRLKSVWELDGTAVNAVVKERKKPKLQFDLDLGLERNNLDMLHRMCEENGAPRITSNVKKKAGKDKAANQGEDAEDEGED